MQIFYIAVPTFLDLINIDFPLIIRLRNHYFKKMVLWKLHQVKKSKIQIWTHGHFGKVFSVAMLS